MNIMELGAIGELVGGVAVIATLIYLAVQIRQGNQAGAREAHRAWVTDMNRGLFEPQLSAEFNEVFQQAMMAPIIIDRDVRLARVIWVA